MVRRKPDRFAVVRGRRIALVAVALADARGRPVPPFAGALPEPGRSSDRVLAVPDEPEALERARTPGAAERGRADVLGFPAMPITLVA